ncbi:MAG: Ig-like domain-containing protein [Solirubrobacteraceae bacterium]|nr:Ig-like domain-containing protein [Solirubrobacteraceae bacterium]
MSRFDAKFDITDDNRGDGWRLGFWAEGGATIHTGPLSDLSWGYMSSAGDYLSMPNAAGKRQLHAGIVCAAAFCPLATSNTVRLRGAKVTLTNATPPSMSNLAGGLWFSSATSWLAGTQSVSFDVGDDVGIRSVRTSIDGGASHLRERVSTCDYTALRPCPASTWYQQSYDTTSLAEGRHSVVVAATDTAGNTVSATRDFYVDNSPPAAPTGISLQGDEPSIWRTVNGFTIAYSNPATGTGSPNTASQVQVCATDSTGAPDMGACETQPTIGSAGGSNTFTVPGPGEYRARVRVHDKVHTGAWSDWSSTLRFDDVVPGKPQPDSYNGWVSGESLLRIWKIRRPLKDAWIDPPSGIAGYAIDRSGAMPGTAIEAVAGLDSEATAAVDLRAWPDGIHTVRTRAISGAGLATADEHVELQEIKIDTGRPSLAIAGAPGQGETISRPVVLAVTATDSLSGMTAAPPDRATDEGGHLAYSIDGRPDQLVRGGQTVLSFADGEHTVRLVAIDVAGNRSYERSLTFKQDTTPPSGGLEPTDPNDPRRLSFFVHEACIKNAVVEISSDAGATYAPLDTSIDGQHVVAHVPSDVWDRREPIHVRARVTDCAGNTAVLDRRWDGSRPGTQIGPVSLPARTPVSLAAAFDAKELRRCDKRRSRTGRKPRCAPATVLTAAGPRTVHVRLSLASGAPLSGRRLLVQRQPETRTLAQWTTVAELVTAPDGSARASVAIPTSVRVRVLHLHDELFGDAMSNTLTSRVRARSTITAPRRLHNGAKLVVSGRLRGDHVPPGMTIALYGYNPLKRRWVPVRAAVKVAPNGRWRAGYRFTSTFRPVRYRFRARIAQRADYPFATAWTRTISVDVSP